MANRVVALGFDCKAQTASRDHLTLIYCRRFLVSSSGCLLPNLWFLILSEPLVSAYMQFLWVLHSSLSVTNARSTSRLHSVRVMKVRYRCLQ